MTLFLDLFRKCSARMAAVLAALLAMECFSEEDSLQLGVLADRLGLARWGFGYRKANIRFVKGAALALEREGLVAIARATEAHAWRLWLTPPSTSWLSPGEWAVVEALDAAGKAVNLNYLVKQVHNLEPGAEGYEAAWEGMADLLRGLAKKPMPIQVQCTESAATGFEVWLKKKS